MRLVRSSFGNKGKPVKTAKGPRYQVRWLLQRDGTKTIKECKRTDFVTKASAKNFIEELDKAHYGQRDPDGRTWSFDRRGRPTNLKAPGLSVLEGLTLYINSRWNTTWEAAQKKKVRGIMSRVVIELTSCSVAQQKALRNAYDVQRTDRGARPEPKTREEWAARWLRDYALLPEQPTTLDPRIKEAKEWMERTSMPVTALDIENVTALRAKIVEGDGGKKKYSTQRTYWQGTVVPFFNWLYETKFVEVDLTRGQTPMRRDKIAEKADPTFTLEPTHVAAQAKWFRQHYGPAWEFFPLIATFCALRIGEALQLRLCDFFLRDGRWYARVGLQIGRVSKSYSVDGKGKTVKKPKSRRHTTPRVREIPLPRKVAVRLVEHYGPRLGTEETYLFRGPRGAVGNVDGVRKWWEQSLREVVVPNAPHLANLTPHAMRHAGMTYWFAQKCDEKRIQHWGGWESVVIMLDTYRGVLDSFEALDLEGLDRFDATWDFADETEAVATTGVAQVTNIVDLDEWRQRPTGVD